MTFSPVSAVFTVLGALLVAGLLSWIRRPRLIVLSPRLFPHSQISTGGQLAEFTIFNRGFKTEEEVELTLNQALRYELVGSSNQETVLLAGKLIVPRIGAGDEVSAIVLVEGGSFSRSDIINCLSKVTKGRIVNKAEDVTPTGPQRVGLAVVFVFFPLLLLALWSAFDVFVASKLPEHPAAAAAKSETAKEEVEIPPIRDWSAREIYVSTSNFLYMAFATEKIRIEFASQVRKKDIVKIPFILENATESPVEFTLSMTTGESEERIPSYDRRVNTMVLPGRSVRREISVVVPLNAAGVDRNIYVEAYLESNDSSSLKLTRTLVSE